jgi:hypothetical protein
VEDSLKEEIQTTLLALMVAVRGAQDECHVGQGYSVWDAVIEDSILKSERLLQSIDPVGVAAAGDMKDYIRVLYKRLLGGLRVEVDERKYEGRRVIDPNGKEKREA